MANVGNLKWRVEFSQTYKPQNCKKKDSIRQLVSKSDPWAHVKALETKGKVTTASL